MSDDKQTLRPNWKASESSKRGFSGYTFEEDVIYYFDTHLNDTLEDIGNIFGITAKQVKQIVMKDS